MKGSIRFTLLMLGIIAMVACLDSGDTKKDRSYDVVFSQDYAVSPIPNVVEGGSALCPSGSKGVFVYNELSFEVEKFYIKNYESSDLFEKVPIRLHQYWFG